MISFKGRHTPKPVILQCVRWYCSYALSYRNIEEMMVERGLVVDHSTLNRWVVRWRMDETYLKVRVSGATTIMQLIKREIRLTFY
jgi:transposase-like protein